MKKLLMVAVLLLSTLNAVAVDQKSLLLGVGIGLGVYTVQKGVVPAMASIGRVTVKAPKAVGRGVKRMVMGPKKKVDAKAPHIEPAPVQ